MITTIVLGLCAATLALFAAITTGGWQAIVIRFWFFLLAASSAAIFVLRLGAQIQ